MPRGLSLQYRVQFAGAIGADARSASAAGVAAGEVFWRRTVSGFEADDAHAGAAYGVRKRALPEHG